MAFFQCNLCSHIYDESKESIKWETLQENWVCPICGSPKVSFTAIQKSDNKPKNVVEVKDVIYDKYECGLCSYLFDEDKETDTWTSLKEDWACPVCGSGKKS